MCQTVADYAAEKLASPGAPAILAILAILAIWGIPPPDPSRLGLLIKPRQNASKEHKGMNQRVLLHGLS